MPWTAETTDSSWAGSLRDTWTVPCDNGTMTHAPTPLIVVDVQNGFVSEHAEHVVAPIARLVDRWFAAGQPVIFTKFINEPGSQWETLIHWRRLRTPPETDLHAKLADHVDSGLVAEKHSYTSLTPEVLSYLGNDLPHTVYLAGIATDGCVLKTAVDLFERGVRPVVVEDCCASHAGPELHAMGLRLIGRFIGGDQIVSAADIDLS